MDDPRSVPEPDTELLYAGYLEQAQDGSGLSFEEFVASHPDHANALRSLHSRLDALHKHLDGVAPESFLAGPGPSPDDAAGTALFEQLKREQPLGRYETIGEFARGGIGAILRVWDRYLERYSAMKIMLGAGAKPGSGGPANDSRQVSRFLREARITGQLEHPGIVPVHEVGVDGEGQGFFTMKLVTGETFRDVIEKVHEGREGWTRTRAIHALLKVCDAMAYAHARGVIHRDLKPANIMVGSFGEVYVMDWGLARSHEGTASTEHGSPALLDDASEAPDLTAEGEILGTPVYMPPEQAHGETRNVGPRSDVYALGTILYHLLSGQLPYVPTGSSRSTREIWQAVREGPPTPLSKLVGDVPAELVAITEKAMARRPEARYPDMREVAEDLRSYVEGRVVSAYESGSFAVLKKWIRRNRALSAAVLAAVIALAVGFAASTWNYLRAEENAHLARRNEQEAKRRTDEVLRLSDIEHVRDLRERAEALWPAEPERIEAFESWLADTGVLLERTELHRTTLEEVRTRSTAGDGSWQFTSTEEQWQHDLLTELVDELEALAEPDSGLVSNVEGRLDFARRVRAETLEDPEVAKAWERVIRDVGNRDQSPLYDGLELAPQVGLVPLGPDPDSWLEEFAYLQSGRVPARENGRLVVSEDMAIVLVLIPGGTFTMGAQSASPAAPNYDPLADRPEVAHEVTVSPFFISKYEMTQGQWLMFTGNNPATHAPHTQYGGSLLHPVENINWHLAQRTMFQLGLTLPTEAQWEFAVRAYTDTPWWAGADRNTMLGAVNLADRAAARAGAQWVGVRDWPELDDGFVTHGPVDALLPNPFGLHHMTGNVWEFCYDGYRGDRYDGLEGLDPVLDPYTSPTRVSRGSCFDNIVAYARSAARRFTDPDLSSSNTGLRAARPLQR